MSIICKRGMRSLFYLGCCSIFVGCYQTHQFSNSDLYSSHQEVITELEQNSKNNEGKLFWADSVFSCKDIIIENGQLYFVDSKTNTRKLVPIDELQSIRYVNRRKGAMEGFLIGGSIVFAIGTVCTYAYILDNPEIGSNPKDQKLGALLGGCILAAITTPISVCIGVLEGHNTIYRYSDSESAKNSENR